MNKNQTQCDRIFNYLKNYKTISQLEALQHLGIMRLASRISEMKRNGIELEKTMKTAKNRYGEDVHYAVYSLKE